MSYERTMKRALGAGVACVAASLSLLAQPAFAGPFKETTLTGSMLFKVNGVAASAADLFSQLNKGNSTTNTLDVGFANPAGSFITVKYTGANDTGAFTTGNPGGLKTNDVLKIFGIRAVGLLSDQNMDALLNGNTIHNYSTTSGGSGGTQASWTNPGQKNGTSNPFYQDGPGFSDGGDWLAYKAKDNHGGHDWTAAEKAQYGSFSFNNLSLGSGTPHVYLELDVIADIFRDTGSGLQQISSSSDAPTGRIILTNFGDGGNPTGDPVPEPAFYQMSALIVLGAGGLFRARKARQNAETN